MSDSILVVLATEADIRHLEEHKTWEPLLLPKHLRDMNRVEIVDVSENEVHTAFEVEYWQEVRPNSQLVLPRGVTIDHYLEPLVPSESLLGDINEKVHGSRLKTGMHMRNEVHWHPLSTWLDLEEKAGHKALATECAACSVELRKDKHSWKRASLRLAGYLSHMAHELIDDPLEVFAQIEQQLVTA